jgi:hypothetical protein
MYPYLWKFDKNEKSDPIQCQPGPKVVMTFLLRFETDLDFSKPGFSESKVQIKKAVSQL